jgi:hypothetical protein
MHKPTVLRTLHVKPLSRLDGTRQCRLRKVVTCPVYAPLMSASEGCVSRG